MPGACRLQTDKKLIEMFREAILTGNNNISEPCRGSVQAWRTERHSYHVNDLKRADQRNAQLGPEQ